MSNSRGSCSKDLMSLCFGENGQCNTEEQREEYDHYDHDRGSVIGLEEDDGRRD